MQYALNSLFTYTCVLYIFKIKSSMKTYVNHPILGRVRVRTAHVKPIAVSHRLYHSYMVSAVEMLERERSEGKLNSVMRHASAMRKSLHTYDIIA